MRKPPTSTTGPGAEASTTGGVTATLRTTPTTRPTPVTTGGAATTTTTTSVIPTTSTSTPTTNPTSPTTGPAEDRTYQLTGGSVGVRFENGSARLLWATPAAGFRVDSSGSDTQVDVRFRSSDHESRLRAFWRDGPQAEIEERD